MIEFCVCGLAVISVTGLTCMHTWLIARMETTNEDVSLMHSVHIHALCHIYISCVITVDQRDVQPTEAG